jgi:hypothetical protein
MKGGGVYYEIFPRQDEKTCLLVIFIEDSRLDAKAEQLKIKAKLKDFNCKLSFKCYAADSFCSFNGRNSQTIINQILSEELEIQTLKVTGVITDSLSLHDSKKRK